jgi:hypothetical protein
MKNTPKSWSFKITIYLLANATEPSSLTKRVWGMCYQHAGEGIEGVEIVKGKAETSTTSYHKASLAPEPEVGQTQSHMALAPGSVDGDVHVSSNATSPNYIHLSTTYRP